MQTQPRNTGEKCNPHGERGANRDGEPPDGTARSISEKDGITLRDHARQKGRNRPKLPHVSKMAKTFLPKRRESKNERSLRVCEAELQISCQIVSQWRNRDDKGVVGISRSTPPAIRRPTERIERTDRSAALVSQSGSGSENLWLCRRGRLGKLLYRRVPHRSVVDSPKTGCQLRLRGTAQKNTGENPRHLEHNHVNELQDWRWDYKIGRAPPGLG